MTNSRLTEQQIYELGIFGSNMWPADIMSNPDRYADNGITFMHALVQYGNWLLLEQVLNTKVNGHCTPVRRDKFGRWPHEMPIWDVVHPADRERANQLILHSGNYQQAFERERLEELRARCKRNDAARQTAIHLPMGESHSQFLDRLYAERQKQWVQYQAANPSMPFPRYEFPTPIKRGYGGGLPIAHADTNKKSMFATSTLLAQNDVPNKPFTGYGGVPCDYQDILRANHGVAGLNEEPPAGAMGNAVEQIINGVDKGIKWQCAPEHLQACPKAKVG